MAATSNTPHGVHTGTLTAVGLATVLLSAQGAARVARYWPFPMGAVWTVAVLIAAIGTVGVVTYLCHRFLPVRATATTAVVIFVLAVAVHPRPDVVRPEPIERAPGHADTPHVVLAIVDGWRADSLSPDGSPPADMPFVEDLAATGWTFPDTIAPAPFTEISVPAIVTGSFPRPLLGEDAAAPVPLPLALRRAGYHTIAIKDYRLDGVLADGRLWDAIPNDCGPAERFADMATATVAGDWYGVRDAMGGYFCLPDSSTRAAIDEGLRHRDGARPVFVLLHLKGGHAPWGDLAGHADARPVSDELRRRGVDVPVATLERARRLYRASLEATDERLDETARALGAHGIEPGNTWWFVTGDHGEAFGEDDRTHHGRGFTRTQIRVPTVVRPAGGLAGPHRIDAPISGLDVAPTIYRALGMKSSATLGEPLPDAARHDRTIVAAANSGVALLAAASGRTLTADGPWHDWIHPVGESTWGPDPPSFEESRLDLRWDLWRTKEAGEIMTMIRSDAIRTRTYASGRVRSP